MNVPQQIEEPRAVPKPVPNYRRDLNYEDLPDWALVGTQEVCRLARVSRSLLDRLVAEGRFPAPGRHGKDRVWPIRAVRAYCARVAAQAGRAD